MADMILVERKMDGLTALAIAHALKGGWTKQGAERDTEKVKRIWRTMVEHMEIPYEGKVR